MTDAERQPWDADRELTLEMATEAIAEAVPELAGHEVALLGSGWDFDAYEVDGAWVFKFPRRAGEVERLERELAVLGRLADTLPLPVPGYRWPLLRAEAFPYAFSGYAKIEGQMLCPIKPSSARVDAVGEALGRFFGVLHAVPVDADLARHLWQGEDPATMLVASRERRRYLLRSLPHCASDEVVERVTAWWDDPAVIPPAHAGPPRLIHDDVHCEHVLMDSEDGMSIAGVIDWGDTALGDPAADFAPLVTWGGVRLLERMLDVYPLATPGFAERALYLTTQLCVVEVDYFHRTKQWIQRAESLALLETLVP
ncbi:MAG: aminoglycoside phosphotransferase family protein [Planctomycetota bacterium]|nr:aminoglycoside phosphotransferase family protein [Planctomycetota bacterium]